MQYSHIRRDRNDRQLTLAEMQRQFDGFRAELREELAQKDGPAGSSAGVPAGSVREGMLKTRGRTRARPKGARGGGNPPTFSIGETLSDWQLGDEGTLPMKIATAKKQELTAQERLIRKELYVRAVVP